jgi:hypothetical protein
MITVMPPSHDNVLGVQATGKVTDQDYLTVLIPQLEEVLKKYGKVRFLYYLDENFLGWELGAMWEDAKFGLRHKDDCEKVAVVGGATMGGLGHQTLQPLHGRPGEDLSPGGTTGGLGLVGGLTA